MKKFLPFAQPLFGQEEKDEVSAALDSGWVTLGPRVKKFEENFANYVGAKHAIALTSCTAALHLSLIALDIGSDDEVITSPFTFVCSANVIIHAGAKPVFADIDPITWNLDPTAVEKKITKNTKAIIPVHYGGHPIDMDAYEKISEKYHVAIIEDAAHAVGASYKGTRIGASGNLVCFSFHAIKNISTGDGGMITTNDDALAEKLSQLRLHGMSKDAWKRHSATGSWKYDIILPGYKYNMSDIQGAIGIRQLEKLDYFNELRKKYTEMYDVGFNNIPHVSIPHRASDIIHSYNLYNLKIDWSKMKISRDEMIDTLKEEGIGANVYFMPAHLFTYYRKAHGYKEGDFPIAEDVSNSILTLPLYPKMQSDDIKYIITKVKKLLQINTI